VWQAKSFANNNTRHNQIFAANITRNYLKKQTAAGGLNKNSNGIFEGVWGLATNKQSLSNLRKQVG